jgi:hypothetical protein
LKFDFKRTVEDGFSDCGFHCEIFGLSQDSPESLDKQHPKSVDKHQKARNWRRGKKTLNERTIVYFLFIM